MVQKFTDFKRQLLEEYVNNITKEQLIELNKLGLTPFKKEQLDSNTIEEALSKQKMGWIVYPQPSDEKIKKAVADAAHIKRKIVSSIEEIEEVDEASKTDPKFNKQITVDSNIYFIISF